MALLISGSVVMAQTNDPAAKQVLDAVSAKFKTFNSVQAGFAYKVEDAKGKAMSAKKGNVWMKGNKYRVSFGGQEIFSDGKTVWNYDKTSNEVTINNVDASASTLTPQKLFTNFYDKDFLYKTNPDVKVGGKLMQEIELTPIDKSKPFFKVLVAVDKATQTIRQTKVFEKNGNRYTYSVTNMSTNAPLSDALFVFDAKKYPKVEIIDLR